MSASSAVPRGTAGAPVRPASASSYRGRAAASSLPIIVGASAVVVSVVLAVVVAAGPASVPILFLGIPLPLVTADLWWVSLIGYLLTPVVVLACYGWDAVGQRNGLRANRDFVLRPGWSRALQWLTGAAIVVGAWHVLNLSVPLSEAWGLS